MNFVKEVSFRIQPRMFMLLSHWTIGQISTLKIGMSEAYFLRIPLGKPSAPAVKGLKALI